MKVPIDHPNWLYELKHDGFRGMLYTDRERSWFRPRKSNEMLRFDALSQQIHSLLKGQRAILDGEIVVLDEQGRSIFADLMMGRVNRATVPLISCGSMAAICVTSPRAQAIRRQLVPKDHPRLLYMSHLDSGGSRFFELVCEHNLEGIACKPKTSPYPCTWIKVKKQAYTQATDRGEWFNRPRK